MTEEEKEAIRSKVQTILLDKEIYGMNSKNFKTDEIILNYIDKLENENIELKAKLEIEKTDNLYNKEEANEEMIPKYKVRKEIKELELEGTKQYWTEDVICILENILEDREMNFDITFCSNEKCKNTDCNRNQNNYDMHYVFIEKPFISIANFEKCEFWEENK